MVILAGVLALTTAAAATGAAAVAGGYGVYRFFKRKVSKRNRQGRDCEDYGRELEVYKVTETKIPPPVAPKPPRRGERMATVVTAQPGLETFDTRPAEATDRERTSSAHTCGEASATRHRSNEALIVRLCPNAIKVLPDPPPVNLLAGLSSSRKGSCNAGRTQREPEHHDVISMKTLKSNLEEDLEECS